MIRWNRILAAVLAAAITFAQPQYAVLAAEETAAAAEEAVPAEETRDRASAEEEKDIDQVQEEGPQAEQEDEAPAPEDISPEDKPAADQEEGAAEKAETDALPPENEAPAEDETEGTSREEDLPAVQTLPENGEETVFLDLGDREDLYLAYANRVFYGTSAPGDAVRSAGADGSDISGYNRNIFLALKPELEKIADGQRVSTSINVLYSEAGMDFSYTAEDLGLEYLRQDGQINPALGTKLSSKVASDYPYTTAVILSAVKTFCPYAMYWSTGQMSSARSMSYSVSDTEVTCSPNAYMNFNFSIDPKYHLAGGSTYDTDTRKTGLVRGSMDLIDDLIQNAAGKSDYHKLQYYTEKICDLVEYDHTAAESDYYSYEDKGPWNLVYVFDGLPSTNVVCEGYAEAFQYLCDRTVFDSSEIRVYSVTGVMDYGTGSGNHKWNIIHMDDGKNYMADLTNADMGSAGVGGGLFLDGVAESVEAYEYIASYEGRTIPFGNGNIVFGNGQITYRYDNNMYSCYRREDLILSGEDYGSTAASPSVDDLAHLKGISLFLTDKVGMRIYVKTDRALADTDYMEFSWADQTARKTAAEAGKTAIQDYNGDQIEVYVFELELRIKQMTDDVSFRMVIDGAEGTAKTYSVKKYADRILKGEYSAKEKNLVRSMLNYGGYTQDYLNYRTDALASAGIFTDEITDPVESQADPDLSAYGYSLERAEDTQGIDLREVTLGVGTDVALIYYYRLAEGKDPGDYSYVIKDPGKKTELGWSEKKDLYYVMITGIRPYELGDSITLDVTLKGDTGVLTSVTYSPFTYCKAKLQKGTASAKLKKICKSLYYYWDAASQLKNAARRLVITVNGKTFTLDLAENEAAGELADRMPMTLTFAATRGTDNVYERTYLSQGLTAEPGTVHAVTGDLVLSGTKELRLFVSGEGSGNYTRIGTIADTDGLYAAAAEVSDLTDFKLVHVYE